MKITVVDEYAQASGEYCCDASSDNASIVNWIASNGSVKYCPFCGSPYVKEFITLGEFVRRTLDNVDLVLTRGNIKIWLQILDRAFFKRRPDSDRSESRSELQWRKLYEGFPVSVAVDEEVRKWRE